MGRGVAWVSGTRGTVLRTTDNGDSWEPCAIPPGGEDLDFRGIQAFDENHAVVMSSGSGNSSRLYRTTDACRTWNLVLTNPDPTGFWDTIRFAGVAFAVLIGDPVNGAFPVLVTFDGGLNWKRSEVPATGDKQAIFAASNSSLLLDGDATHAWFVTGAGTTSFVQLPLTEGEETARSSQPPLAAGDAAGGFSIAARTRGSETVIVVVGGDYTSPDVRTGTAATGEIDSQGNVQWRVPRELPGGYRSGVDFHAATGTWIAVGPGGIDISKDDGSTWQPLATESTADAETVASWNAISIPFVVGRDGKIARLSGF